MPTSFVDRTVQVRRHGERVGGGPVRRRLHDGRPGALLRQPRGRVRHGLLHRGASTPARPMPRPPRRRWPRARRSPPWPAQTQGGGPQGCDILYGVASSLAGRIRPREPAAEHGLQPDRGERHLPPGRDHLEDAHLVRQGQDRGRERGAELRGPPRPARRSTPHEKAANDLGRPALRPVEPANAEVLPPTSPCAERRAEPVGERRRHVHGGRRRQPGSPPSRWGGTVPTSRWWAWGPPARSS